MKLRIKLPLSFLIIFGITMTIGIISYFTIIDLSKNIDKITKDQTDAMIKLEELKSTYLEGVEEGFAYLALNDSTERDEFFTKMELVDQLAFEYIQLEGEERKIDDEESKMFESLINEKQETVKSAIILFDYFEKNGIIKPEDASRFENSIDDVVPIIDLLIEDELNQIHTSVAETDNIISLIGFVIPSIIILSACISITLGYFNSKSIINQLSKIRLVTKKISKGEFDEAIKISGSNEIDELSYDVNQMQKRLKTNEKIIQNQIAKLKKTNSVKSEFASFISHELKNPLVPIRSYSELLLSKNLGELNEKQIDRIKLIKSSAESMQKIISDFSEVQKIESDALTLNKQECFISELISQAVQKLMQDISKNNIKLTTNFHEGIKCNCDKEKISQVIANLLTNALDFCPKKQGEISISLESDKNNIRIMIQDNGVGIAKENLKKVFESYYQVDATLTREYGGTGLGLAICKGIIEQHGGKIWIESKVGSGTQVFILLPKTNTLKSIPLQKEAEQEIDMR